MADLQPLKEWCDKVAKYLDLKSKKTNPKGALDEIIKKVDHELKQVEILAKEPKNKKLRVVEEQPRYEQRVDSLKKATSDTQLTKLSDKEARSLLEKTTSQFQDLYNSIRLARSHSDPKLSEDPEVKQLRKAAAQKQPVYENMRRLVEQAIEQLKTAGPGAEEQIKLLESMLINAQILEPNFEAAHGALSKRDRVLNSGMKAINGFDKNVPNDDYKLQMKRGRQAIDAFRKAYGAGPKGEVETWNKILLQQRATVKGLAKGDPKFNVVVEDLKQMVEKAQKLLADLNQMQPAAEENLIALERALDELVLVAPTSISEEHLKVHQDLRNQVKNLLLSTDLLNSLTRAKEAVETDARKCNQEKKSYEEKVTTIKLEERLKSINEFRQTTDNFPLARALAFTIGGKLAEQEIPQLLQQHEYQLAKGLWDKHESSLQQLDNWLKTWKSTQPNERAKLPDLASTAIPDVSLRVEAQLIHLANLTLKTKGSLNDQKVLHEKHAKVMAGPAQLQLSSLLEKTETLHDDIRSAISQVRIPRENEKPEDQNTRLQKTYNDLKARLDPTIADEAKKLILELKKTGPSDKEINEREKSDKLDLIWSKSVRDVDSVLDLYKRLRESLDPNGQNRKDMDKAIVSIEGLPKNVYGSREDFAKLLEKDRLELDKTFTQKILAAEKAIDEWKEKAKSDLVKLCNPAELKKKREQREKTLKSLNKQLAELVKPKKERGKKKAGEETPMKMPWAEYGEALLLDLSAAMAMAESSDWATANEGLKQLESLESTLDDLATVPPQAKASKLAISFQAVEVKLKQLEQLLTPTGSKVLFDYAPAVAGRLQGEFKTTLIDRLKGLKPEDAEKLIAEMKDQVDKEITTAKDLAEKHIKLFENQEGKTLKDEIDKFKKAYGSTHPKLLAELERGLEDARKNTHGGYSAVLLQVRDLTLRVTMLNDSTKNEARDSQDVRAGQEENQRQEALTLAPERYRSALAVFNQDLRRQASELYDRLGSKERNSSLFAQIKVHLKSAGNAAKQASKVTGDERSKQYDIAMRSLELAQDTARMFIAQPLKELAASRKNLVQAADRWKLVVASFLLDVEKLDKRIDQLIGEHQDQDQKRLQETQNRWRTIQPRLRDAKKLFDAGAFDDAAKTLGQAPGKGGGEELSKRRALKEEAIDELSRFERAMDHPILDLLRSKPPVEVRLSALPAALMDMRKSLLTS